MEARLKTEGIKDEKDVLSTVERRVAAVISDHGADFSVQNNALVISLNEKNPTEKNCRIVEIANGALMERLHPCEV
jgi:hypothetical protein